MSTMTASESAPARSGGPRSGPYRGLRQKLRTLLQTGLDRHSAGLAISFGVTLGVLPLPLGTSLLCGLIAWRLRLNQPLVQLVNYLCYPLQIALYLIYCRTGIDWFADDSFGVTLPDTWHSLPTSAGVLVSDLWQANLYGLGAWLVSALMLLPFSYLTVRLVLQLPAALQSTTR